MKPPGNRRLLSHSGSAYLLAILATAAVLFVRFAAHRWLTNDAPLVLFMLPLLLAAWIGGLRPGLFATVLACSVGSYFFVLSSEAPYLRPLDCVRIVVFLALGGIISRISEGFHRQEAARRALEQSLRDSREQLLRAVQKVAVPTLLHAEDGEILVVNEAWTDITGYRHEDIPTVGEWTVRAYGERHETVKQYIDQLFESDCRLDNGEWIITTASGEKRIWHFFTTPMGCAPDGRRLLLSNAIDVTVRRQAEKKLGESEERYRVMTEVSPQTVWSSRPDGYITYCNQHWLDYSGMTMEQSEGNGWTQAIHPDARQRVLNAWFEAWQTGSPYEVEIPFRRASDGMYRWHLAKGLPIKDEAGRITKWIGVAIDIHDHRQAQELEDYRRRLEEANARLELLATTDGLTRLKNRRAFQERLTHEVQHSRRHHSPLSLLLLDVDHFKQFNDAFGHRAGDAVLQSVGRLLEEAARETDCVARFGGEEFALILPATNETGAQILAERCRLAIQEGDWLEAPITVSIGAATLEVADGEEALIERADAALYASKRGGRNCVNHANRCAVGV